MLFENFSNNSDYDESGIHKTTPSQSHAHFRRLKLLSHSPFGVTPILQKHTVQPNVHYPKKSKKIELLSLRASEQRRSQSFVNYVTRKKKEFMSKLY
jgi:hypothetical protein